MKASTKNEVHISRRRFLRQSACTALGYTGIVSTLSHLTLVNSAVAQTTMPGYKALVVIFLAGGNDSNNMLIPRMGHPEYANYKSARGPIAILDPDDSSVSGGNRCLPLTTPDGNYGLHYNMQPAVDLFQEGDLSFIANVGSLVYPVIDQDHYRSGAVELPPKLMSHSNQQLQWQSSIPDQPFQSGWGGRIADLLSQGNADTVGMGISLAGINKLQVGLNSTQYALSANGTVSMEGYGSSYHKALNADGTYKNTVIGQRLKAFDQIMNFTHSHLLEDSYNQVVRRARENEGIIEEVEAAANATGINFTSAFGSGSTNLSAQLRMIAKMIAGRSVLGNTRQIYFASVSGYDTHAEQGPAHANLMEELAESLKTFRDTMVQLGVHNDVLTMTHSDFSRTLAPNRPDSGSGTDHAWGGHHLVMGGAVDGGRIFGHFPSLVLGGIQDINPNFKRGRFIPSTSVDQYVSVAAKWFGVGTSEMETILPNLPRFDDPLGSAANLNYIS